VYVNTVVTHYLQGMRAVKTCMLQISTYNSTSDFFSLGVVLTHVTWDPGHHSMMLPQILDEGEGLQIWRVAVNILSKQS
jgi:hypothetical protein